MATTLAPTEDQVFNDLWDWINSLFIGIVDPITNAPYNVFKGFQNNTATSLGSYVIVSPGVNMRQDSLRHDYDSVTGKVFNRRHTTYSYQVDCFGPAGPDNATIVSIAWRTMTACDALEGKAITPLYADEPTQLNIVNGENMYEQRFSLKLYAQINQTVTQDQDFFGGPVPIVVEAPPADLLPVG